MSEPTRAVPKFASFKAKAAHANAPSLPPPVPEERDRSRSRRKRHGEGSREDRSSDQPRHGRVRSTEKDNHRSPLAVPRATVPALSSRRTISQLEWKPPENEVFTVDKMGDVQNLVYGSIHRYSVPHFHRFASGHVLGAPISEKIDRDFSDDKGILLCARKPFSTSSRQKYVFSKVEKERPRLLKIRRDLVSADELSQEAEFVSIQIRTKTQEKHISNGDSSELDHDATHYRSIEGKAKPPRQPIDTAFEYDSDSSSSEAGRKDNFGIALKKRSIDVARAVEASPRDIDAWLALIEHQDVLLESRNQGRRITNAETQSTAEVKIHIYEKALENAQTSAHRELLLVGLMAEGTKVWDIKVQSSRWAQIAKDHMDSPNLWKAYLNSQLTMFTSFRYEEVREVFLERKTLLLNAISSAPVSQTEPLYQQLLYVLLRYSVFVRESGYSELAIALWQALLEFNLCAPLLAANQTLSSIREFWESEVPRIGEDGALGWRHYLENERASGITEPIVDSPEMALDQAHIFRDWVIAERLRNREARNPARTMDEVTENDPYRVILFTDLEDMIVSIPRQSELLQQMLINAYLVFCRLPPMSSIAAWTVDPLLGGNSLDYSAAWIKTNCFDAPKTAPNQVEKDDNSAINLLSSKFATSSDHLFGGNWFPRLRSWSDTYGGDHGPLAYKMIRNSLTQLTSLQFREDLAEYYLAFEFVNEPKTIKKACKELLKKHPSSLRLYNAYALIEWSRGNRDISSGVFTAALGMSKSSSDEYSIFLWRNWIWKLIESNEYAAALNCTLSIPDGIPNTSSLTSPLAHVKFQQHAASMISDRLAKDKNESAVAYGEVVALYSYLYSKRIPNEPQSAAQGDISSALDTFTRLSSDLLSKDLVDRGPHELLLQSASRLLVHHSKHGPYRPALLEKHFTNFVSLFPDNTVFLTLLTTASKAATFSILAHRSLFMTHVLTPTSDCLSSRFFAIRYEVIHGTVHSVRSACEHAISSSVCKSAPALWKLYILFMASKEKEFGRKAVKEVWKRAITSCPWSKELFITGFEEVQGVQDDELRSVWRIMGEKELRIHVDLEEAFEDLDEANPSEGDKFLLTSTGSDSTA